MIVVNVLNSENGLNFSLLAKRVRIANKGMEFHLAEIIEEDELRLKFYRLNLSASVQINKGNIEVFMLHEQSITFEISIQ